jgi:tetratricopeptide (TPR) repeat protein
MGKTIFKTDLLIENRYRVLKLVSLDRMGALYRVSDEAREGEVVALKTVILDVPAEEKPEHVRQFQREFKILTQLHHPNLVDVYDFGVTTEGELYFTMEWVEGQDLDALLCQLEPAAVTSAMVQVCRALAYLHARGVIHGDLKPSNVLLMDGADDINDAGHTGDRRHRVKLVDFGVALEIRTREVRARYHTPGYTAPEIKERCLADHRADLYGLGATWYAALVGESPVFMPGPGKEPLVQLTLEQALGAESRFPAEIGPVIARLMARSPAERYSSANEVIEAVNEITGSAYELETEETATSYALRARFVDRVAESEMLQTCWEQAQVDEGTLVLVSGEGGVGKTRLVEEFVVQAELEGAYIARGQCVENGGVAYRPWREVLRVLTRYVEGVSGAESKMEQVGPVLATLLPELWERDYMQGLAPPVDLEPQAARLRLNDAILQVLRTAAEVRPTVIVIDDAQWADEATLELLRFLARSRGSARLQVCVTYRDDEGGPAQSLTELAGSQIEHIPLHRLPPEDATDLVRSMLGLEQLPTSLTERVQRTTEGNAFFVQELIRSLAEDGVVLQRTVEGWRVDRAALQEAQLPESIRQVVWRRLAQLSEETRQVLRWAAVVGVVFWEGILEDIGRVPRVQVRVALHEGKEQGVVTEREESAFAGEREYLFSSPTGQAATYLHRAGEQAATRFINAEAVAYFDRALDLAPVDERADRYTLLLAREKVYDLQGAREAQIQDLVAMKELVEVLADDRRRIEVSLRQAHYAEATGDFPAAVAAAQEAIQLAQTIQDVSSEARGYRLWGEILWNQGDYKAAQSQLEQALALARAAGVREVEAGSLRDLGVVFWFQGDYAGPRVHFEQSLRIYREMGDRQEECGALNNLDIVSVFQGDYVGARAYYEQSLQLSREIGSRRDEGIALNNIGDILCYQGDYAGARERLAQALCVGQSIGDRANQGYIMANMGRALVGLEHWAEAAAAYQQALALRQELGQQNLAIECLAGLATVSLAQDDLAQAQTLVEEILNYPDLEDVGELLEVYLTCYHVLRAGQDPRAQTILEKAHHLLQEEAAKIADEEMRRSFLENVPAHREIMEAWEGG